MPLEHFALTKLEFDKIRSLLAGYTSTSSGKERIASLRPDTNRQDIILKLEQTGEMLGLLESSQAPPLQTLTDIRNFLVQSRIERFILDGSSLASVGRWAVSSRLLRTFFSGNKESAPLLHAISGKIMDVRELENQINRVVDEKGEIKENASPELSRINRHINRKKQAARSALVNILRKGREAGFIGEEEATLRAGRMVIPVRVEHKRKIHGLIHDTSSTGQTVFMEPVEVFEANNEIRELESARKREQERLLRELTELTGRYSRQMEQNMETIGLIDAIYARARTGRRWDGVIPEISQDHRFLLRDSRNPLLLLKYPNTEKALEQVVPLSLEIEPDEKGVMITGPNAGGKSVTLKTFGLLVVLAQCGIPVPACEGARVPCVSGLYLDMGDEQSIENDLSTFSSRLNWMKQVLLASQPGSWVLIDEAGSGTDPDEGTALVKSFLELLSDKQVRCMVTTHHGDLKLFAHETPGWSNASMEFDRHSLSPTYRFRKGIPGSSYAFEIAERLELPHNLVKKARNWTGTGKNRMESLIISLEQDVQKLREQQAMLRKKEQSVQDSRDELEKRLERVREEREKIRNRALQEAEEILQQANRRIEEAIRAASLKEKETLREKRTDIARMEQDVTKRRARQKKKRKYSTLKPQGPLRPGDPVRLIDSNTTGELVETDGKKATVIINGLRVRTSHPNLERSDRLPEKKTSRGYRLTSSEADPPLRAYSGRLDIRGYRGEEAVRSVTAFVDEGLARGLERLAIIHGKGDGILKKLVHEHLSSRKDVSRYEQAPMDEGGDGCTYVWL